VPKEKSGILVDEQFGAAILRDAAVAEIARRYREWVDIFEKARASP
jgi:hypothetical protein